MRTMKDKPVSPQQIKALHVSFHAHGMDDNARHECISSFTNGRTASCKYLTMNEARQLLSKLNPEADEKTKAMLFQEKRVLYRSIYFLASQISFLNKDYPSDMEEDRQMNIAKINVWCRARTKYRKTLKEMTVWELKDVKKQLEAIARKEPDAELEY